MNAYKLNIYKPTLVLISLAIAQLCGCVDTSEDDTEDFFDTPAEAYYPITVVSEMGLGIILGARPAPEDEQRPAPYKTERITATLRNVGSLSFEATAFEGYLACTDASFGLPAVNGRPACIDDANVLRYEGDSTLRTDCRDASGNLVQVSSSMPLGGVPANKMIFTFSTPPWIRGATAADPTAPSCNVWFNASPIAQSNDGSPDVIKGRMWFENRYSNAVNGYAAAMYFINLERAGEICDNCLDDDGNGLLDCQDPSCHCGKISKDPTKVVNTNTPGIAQWEMHNKIDPTNAQVSVANDGVAVCLSNEQGNGIFFERIAGSEFVGNGRGRFIYESDSGDIRYLRITEKVAKNGSRAYKVDKMVALFPYTVDLSHDPKFVQTVHIGPFSAYTRGNWSPIVNGWKLTSKGLVYP